MIFWQIHSDPLKLQVYYSRKIVRPPAKQKSHQYSFAWRKQFLQKLRPHPTFCPNGWCWFLPLCRNHQWRWNWDDSVMRFVIGILMAGQMLVPEIGSAFDSKTSWGHCWHFPKGAWAQNDATRSKDRRLVKTRKPVISEFLATLTEWPWRIFVGQSTFILLSISSVVQKGHTKKQTNMYHSSRPTKS